MRPKFTAIENELMGRHRGLIVDDETKSEAADNVLMPELEDKQLAVNQRCVDEAKTLISCLQVNRDGWPRMTEADRKMVLGEAKNWQAYSDLHLAVDTTKPEDTRMHYLNQVVKDGIVYLRPLMKLAADCESCEVKAAAVELCKAAGIMEENGIGKPQRSAFACPVMAMGRSCPMNTTGRCAHLNDGEGCKILGDMCSLAGPVCPLMKAGEGCPMDAWSGCAQLNAEGECGLQDGGHCCMIKETKGDDEDGEKAWSPEARAAAATARAAKERSHTRAVAANSAIEKLRNNNEHTLAASRASNAAEMATSRNGVGSIQSRSNHSEAAAKHSVAATRARERNDHSLAKLHMTAAIAHEEAAKL